MKEKTGEKKAPRQIRSRRGGASPPRSFEHVDIVRADPRVHRGAVETRAPPLESPHRGTRAASARLPLGSKAPKDIKITGLWYAQLQK